MKDSYVSGDASFPLWSHGRMKQEGGEENTACIPFLWWLVGWCLAACVLRACGWDPPAVLLSPEARTRTGVELGGVELAG